MARITPMVISVIRAIRGYTIGCMHTPRLTAKSLFVGVGERYPNEVVIRFFKVE